MSCYPTTLPRRYIICMETMAANPKFLGSSLAKNLSPSSDINSTSVNPINTLVISAQKGDRAAFTQLYEYYYGKVFRYVRLRTDNIHNAEDITEDVFLKMIESINSFKPKGYPFSSWLFRVAHNLIVDHYRKHARRKTKNLDDIKYSLSANSNDMDDNLEIKIEVNKIIQVLPELTDLQREIISLRFGAGLSLLETAEATNKNVNSVKALQHAAIKKIRTLLESTSDCTSKQNNLERSI